MQSCDVCQGKAFETLFSTEDYLTKDQLKIIKCKSCLLVATTPRLNNQKLQKYYTSYREKTGKRFPQPIENLLNFWHLRRVASINKSMEKGTILDIGCGRGVEIQKLKDLGWNSYGTEYYHDSKLSFEKKGINIYLGNFWDAKYPGNFFDVVTMWHSFEHITEPVKAILEIKRILKKRGIVKIAVPNFDSWERSLSNSNWFHLDVPRHQYHFSGQSLSRLLEKSGFKVIKIKYIAPEYDFYSIWQTFLNMLPIGKKALIYRLLNKEEKFSLLAVIQVTIQIPFAVIFGFLSFIYVPLSWIFKKSGTLELTAVKV